MKGEKMGTNKNENNKGKKEKTKNEGKLTFPG